MQEAERLPVASDFGKLLRDYRLTAGLSQEALAERAKMSAFAISALERGHRRKPQSKTLELLVEALSLDDEQRANFEAAARAGPRAKNSAVTVGPWAAPSDSPFPQTNLPRQLTPLIGREDDLAKLVSLAEAHPLITLVGAGGVGKTRLALRAGETLLEDSPDGVWLVELAAVGETASPLQAIAKTFGLHDREKRPLVDVVLQYLESRRLTLIVDNCEHVIAEAARVIDALLRQAPHLRILATSREPLRVAAERVYRVPSLAVPTSSTLTAAQARRYGAVELFAERAEAALAGFALSDENAPALVEICRRLDGIPLAIELAAARTRVLCVREIAERLDERFTVLNAGGRTSIPRQQTLRALIDWSYDLLSESESALFRRLAVFPGDFAFDSVAAAQGNDAEGTFERIASLVEKSLVHADTIGGNTRFRLPESVRAYAREQLTANGELEAAAAAHARSYLMLAERLESVWDDTPDVEWKAAAEPELENWRAALRWAFAPGGDREIGLGLIVALRPVWFTLAPSEGLGWVRAGLDACGDARHDRIRAWLDLSAAHLSMVAQQYGDAAASAQRALAAFTDLGEQKGSTLARLFSGASSAMLGDAKTARDQLCAVLEEGAAAGARRTVGAALLYLAALELGNGDADAARNFFAEALTLFKTLGASRPAAHVALNLAELEFKSGNPTAALRLANEALEADGALSDSDAVAYDLCNVAAYEVALCSWDDSIVHASEALDLARERGLTSAVVWSLQHLAAAAALRPIAESSAAIEVRRRAACLMGFVDARIAEYDLHRDFTERQEQEQALTALRSALGAETDALIQEGRTWSEARAFQEGFLV